MKTVEPSVSVLRFTAKSEELIEEAGRTSHQSQNRIKDKSVTTRFIKDRVKAGHHSILEHACVTLRIVCDRGVSHELVRHRIASYTQESTRFCDYEKDGITVIEPPQLTPKARAMWYGACKTAEDVYIHLRQEGVSPQIARSVLPTCLKTEIVVTMNLRSWRNFLDQRLISPPAQPQMAEIARMVRDRLVPIAPTVFEDYLTTEQQLESELPKRYPPQGEKKVIKDPAGGISKGYTEPPKQENPTEEELKQLLMHATVVTRTWSRPELQTLEKLIKNQMMDPRDLTPREMIQFANILLERSLFPVDGGQRE